MSEPVYFLKLEMENVRCFGEKAVLDLSDGQGNWRQWTVILGDNGTGKTTILQILAAAEIADDVSVQGQGGKLYFAPLQSMMYYTSAYSHPSSLKLGKSFFELLIDNKKNRITRKFELNLDHKGIIATGYSLSTDISQMLGMRCFGYGANRLMERNSLSVNQTRNSETLFGDHNKLVNAEEWLLQLDYGASRDSEIQEYAEEKREQVKNMLIELLPDVNDIRFTEPTKENLKPSVQFNTALSGWVSIHQLSLGYKTMVAWMVDLAARLFERYPDSDNPLAEPAIVLVDEIDLHMHPKWQRKIFDYLTERFPKTQFVVTAHSPLVVQAAPIDANIVLLRKEGDHVVIDNEIESVHNWRLDQILSSDLFGIESPRGPETEKWLTERKGLLQKQALTKEEGERLTELNEKTRSLPTADNPEDINAMEVIRKAAEYLQSQKA